MGLEILAYIILIIVTLSFSLNNFNKVFFDRLSIFLLILYIVVVRYSGFDYDMRVYASTLEIAPSRLILFPRYFTEFGYWISSSFLYSFIKNKEVVFLLFDIMAIFMVYKAFKNRLLPIYSFLLFFLFFPSLMGYQNVYRQFLAVSILLYAFSFKDFRVLFLILFAGTFHNLSFMFLPLFFLKLGSKKFFLLSSITILFCFKFIPKPVHADHITGLDMFLFYVLMFVLILIFFIVTNNMKIKDHYIFVFLGLLYIITLLIVSNIYLTGLFAERIGMVGLQLLYPYLIYVIEDKFKFKPFLRLMLIIILVLPTFLFSSALGFLM